MTSHLVAVNQRLLLDLLALPVLMDLIWWESVGPYDPILVDLVWTGLGERHDQGTTQHRIDDLSFMEITYGVTAVGVIAYDTDGVPYFGTDVPDAVPIAADTDGVPYLTV